MTSALSKRLERLEALMAARSSGPLRFVELWYGETLEETVAKKVAAGELPENCRVQGVETWRSRRKDHGHLPPTPRLPAPPAPPELKLLPAPIKTEASPERIPISSHHRTRGSDLGLRISCAWRCRVRTRCGGSSASLSHIPRGAGREGAMAIWLRWHRQPDASVRTTVTMNQCPGSVLGIPALSGRALAASRRGYLRPFNNAPMKVGRIQ